MRHLPSGYYVYFVPHGVANTQAGTRSCGRWGCGRVHAPRRRWVNVALTLFYNVTLLLSSCGSGHQPGHEHTPPVTGPRQHAPQRGIQGSGSRLAADLMAHPAEFFSGSIEHPTLEIITPANGAVLDDSNLDIVVDVRGYRNLPSRFHDSRICLGLASHGEQVLESCFEQGATDLVFHASGLLTGQSYALRVVLFERSNALAVSMRSFRVGAVSISDGVEVVSPVTIQTALQVALAHHTVGGQLQAEQIYRQIIGQHPTHPDALHLLGLVLYQNGETDTAISYIEKALNSTTDYAYQNFHNSLGECLRAAGRPDEALEHYQLALAIDADFTLAEFNSGLTYQELNKWDTALEFYERVLAAARRVSGFGGSEGEEAVVMEAQIRRCDLLHAQEHLLEARACWEEGIVWWTGNAQMRNELGNVHMQLGSLKSARESYEAALTRGLELAELNVAIVLELEGSTSQSVKRFEKVLNRMRANNLPDRHVMIKMATVLPRVLPGDEELDRLRRRMEQKLDDLLALSWNSPSSAVDNSPPLRYGFSTGFHLAFHGENNRMMKTKLYRVYSLFCPALLSGRYLTEGNIMQTNSVVTVAPPRPPNENVRHHIGDRRHVDTLDAGGGRGYWRSDSELPSVNSAEAKQRKIRVGWVSRFFHKHPVGLLSEGIIEKLPRDKFEVQVFMIRPWPADGSYFEEAFADDETFQRVQRSADQLVRLSDDLAACASTIRGHQLDVLVFPELGLDPVTYFLSFARLATVQVASWGHPDTSGIRNVDYFVSSEIEVADADRHYTERLYRMQGLGAYFYRPQASLLTAEAGNTQLDPQEIRETMRRQLGLPSSSHLFLCPQALFKFHPAFDDMLVKILSRDKLAYLLLLNGKDRHAWSSLLVERMTSKMNTQDQGHRVLFYKVTGEREMLVLYQAADVVLDTYPAGSYITSLQALSVGVPVVTLPSQLLAGRLTLAMYERMDIMDVVAKSPNDFVKIALQLAHNADLRSSLSSRILALNYRLFHDTQAVTEWDNFLTQVVATRKEEEEEEERANGISNHKTEKRTDKIGG